MRVMLVESGVLHPERFVYQCYPPHGLMYLAASVRRLHPEHELRLVDMMIDRLRPADLAGQLNEYRPDLVGIHAMTFQAGSMHQVAGLVKQLLPETIVAVGGPHATADPEAVLQNRGVDLVGIGEGERTFVELVERIAAGQAISGIPGTVTRGNGSLVRAAEREFIENLDELPYPAWDLIDLKKFFGSGVLNQNDITWRKELTTIFTSRACPYGCIYCHNIFGKKFRARTPENVLAEINALIEKYGIRELHVIDDCFNFDMDRAKAILSGIVSAGLDLKLAFPNGVRGDRIDEEMLKLMKAAGVYKINFGIESGSERVQKMIRKGLNLAVIKETIARVAGAGIFTHGFFMLGFPDETEEEMNETIEFACSSRLHTAGFALLSPFPGTRVYEIAEERGIKVQFDPADTSYSQISGNISAASDEALKKIHRRAHWKFYFDPVRMARIIGTMPHKADFLRNINAHFKLKFL